MDRAYRRGEEVLKVSARVEGERLHVATSGGEHTFDWQELAPGDYLLRAGGVQRRCVVARDGEDRWLWIDGHIHHLKLATESRRRAAPPAGELSSPMPGQVLKVLVRPGDRVRKDQTLVVLEAMKMQYEIVAPRDGVVASVHAAEGAQVAGGVGLVVLEEAPAE